MDLLSEYDKEKIHQVFDNIHDTFSREIEIYTNEQESIINIDNTANPLFPNKNNKNIHKNFKSYKKKARIKYIGDQEKVVGIGSNNQLNLAFSRGEIRLKVDEETFNLIKNSTKIKVDDALCELISSPARPGPFSPNYWTIQLKRLN